METRMRMVDAGDGTFSLVGLTRDEVAMLGGLADFPLWSAQPNAVGKFCESLHKEADTATGDPFSRLSASGQGMAPEVAML